MAVKIGRQAEERTPGREPTRREFLIAYVGTLPAVLLLWGMAKALSWSRTGFAISGFVLVAVYVPIALGWLFLRPAR